MTPYPHPIIAREGWPFLGIAALVSAVATFFIGWWWLPLGLPPLFILQFSRAPARQVPDDPLAVVSPADGRIVWVGKSQDPYLKREALKVSGVLNEFNAHSNRSPVEGVGKRQ